MLYKRKHGSVKVAAGDCADGKDVLGTVQNLPAIAVAERTEPPLSKAELAKPGKKKRLSWMPWRAPCSCRPRILRNRTLYRSCLLVYIYFSEVYCLIVFGP